MFSFRCAGSGKAASTQEQSIDGISESCIEREKVYDEFFKKIIEGGGVTIGEVDGYSCVWDPVDLHGGYATERPAALALWPAAAECRRP